MNLTLFLIAKKLTLIFSYRKVSFNQGKPLASSLCYLSSIVLGILSKGMPAVKKSNAQNYIIKDWDSDGLLLLSKFVKHN